MRFAGVASVLLCDRGYAIWSSYYPPGDTRRFLGGTLWRYALDSDAMRAQFARCLATGRAEGLNLAEFPDDEPRLWRAVWHRVDGVPGVRCCVVYRELPVEVCHLTARQQDVLREIVDSDTVAVACMRLGITARTYHSHVANIRATLRRNDLRQVGEWIFGAM